MTSTTSTTIKAIKAEITALQSQIWRNCRYLDHSQKQLALTRIHRGTVFAAAKPLADN